MASPQQPPSRHRAGSSGQNGSRFSPSTSRDPSAIRSRAFTTSSNRDASPRPPTASGHAQQDSATEFTYPMERKASNSSAYGHHRQTSIIHGSVQHSRNTSFVTSPTASPLSNQVVTSDSIHRVSNGLESVLAEYTAGVPIVGGQDVARSPIRSPEGSVPPPALGARKLQRMHSSSSRHSPRGSESRQMNMEVEPIEAKTVGEYALHHLFNSFIATADVLINQCAVELRSADMRLESVCGSGVDPNFDQLIIALGHISRLKPKPLIDSLVQWRVHKSKAADAARTALDRYDATKLPPGIAQETLNNLQRDVILAGRRSAVAVYLLCRGLTHIFEQSTLEAITSDVATRLEGVIFDQLFQADADWLKQSPLDQSNWVMFGQLLGVMSGLDFGNVTRRFLMELESMQLHVPRRDAESKAIDSRAILVIRGMQWLRVKHTDPVAWNDFCDFMHKLATISSTASGQAVKYEFNVLFEELLMPLAANASSELNTPKWRITVETLRSKIVHMHGKPKHWANTFPTLAILTCASPEEVFSAQWYNLITTLPGRLKDRATRPTALRAVCRLTWTYLYRIADSPSAAIKALGEVSRLLFVPGRRGYVSTEAATADPLVVFIRIVGFKYPELCFRQIIFPLINHDLFMSDREVKVTDLDPEKIAVGIRGFLALISDLERGTACPFPVNFTPENETESSHATAQSIGSRPPTESVAKSSVLREERLSRPVMIGSFSQVTIDAYMQFCDILAKVTIFCDNHFGGQVTLDEKFSQAPKTPIADTFSFNRRDDPQSLGDLRQGFYDLLHVAIQALPRCLSQQIPLKSVVNLLCIGTAHVQSNIAASSAQSLKSIARQAHAQVVTVGFARFIFNFNDRYATMSDGGMLGPAHIEDTLNLYIELLRIWIEETTNKTRRAVDASPQKGDGPRSVPLDVSALHALVDEVESHGLFFLCSTARNVRTIAIEVLRLVLEFDKALQTENPNRIIAILDSDSELVLDVNDERLTVAEKSRIQRGLRKSNTSSTLIELCASEAPYDATLWLKIVPNLIRVTFEKCPFATTLTREMICLRLSQMQKIISGLAGDPQKLSSSNLNSLIAQDPIGIGNSPPDVIIGQWKLYLIFACTTLTVLSPHYNKLGQETHSRQNSKSSQHAPDKVMSAAELFAKIIPFLAVKNSVIREAVVTGVVSIPITLYRTLLEALKPVVVNCNDEARVRAFNHQRTTSSPKQGRSHSNITLRTEVAHVYRLTSNLLKKKFEDKDDWILANIVSYTRDLRIYLNDSEIQPQSEFTKLRTYFCGLTEVLFEVVSKTPNPERWVSFQSRQAAFALMEEWSGFAPMKGQNGHRQDASQNSFLERIPELNKGSISNAALERDKRDLRTAALSAMASLCGGPIAMYGENKAVLQFDVPRMLTWIDSIFNTSTDKNHATGRKALKNLIIHNREYDYFIDCAIDMCYRSKSPKALESYFHVVDEVLTESHEYGQSFWKVICICLFTLGNENYILRMKSAKLLRLVETREAQTSAKLQELDISVSDKTIAVYKRAQFEMSQKLALHYPQLAFHVFSEFARFFRDLQPDTQRQMVAAMLPWVQAIELQADINGGPTAPSYMLLVNLFEITARCSSHLHNEIQGLWQALANSSHAGNAQLILDFILTLCLEKREQNFVNFAKQIIVHLADTAEGSKVIDFLLLHISPRSMIQERERLGSLAPPPEANMYSYLADLDHVLPGGATQQGFSFGQLCLILLVDLVVAPLQVKYESITTLLQMCLILWDSYIPIVQDHAREMLVHLIHESVRSKLDEDEASPTRRTIEDLIEAIRQENPRVTWHYDEYNGKKEEENELRLPESMTSLATELVTIFSAVYPDIQKDWGRTALEWASTCSVHHLACRSFQVYRTLSSGLDESMLSTMLARLSNTIADEAVEVQTFSMEILTTLRTVVDSMSADQLRQYPQLFWTTCACLDTVHEHEFMEALAMLQKFVDKLNFRDAATLQELRQNKPPYWQTEFEGVQALIYKGLRSSESLESTLKLLTTLSALPSDPLIGVESRLLYAILANLPYWLRWFETEREEGVAARSSAEALAKASEQAGHTDIATCLRDFTDAKCHNDAAFMSTLLSVIRNTFFPTCEFECLVFIMSLLTNQLDWYRLKSLQILHELIPHIDMSKSEIRSSGPDIIAPLLRLLQTEHCQQALLVLDKVMLVSPGPQDNKHLRMSMVGADTNLAVRKQYDRVQSLYGIPEDSGWAIPIPAEHAATTRSNVHAVFRTCFILGGSPPSDDATPKIELVSEEYTTNYFARTATMLSDDTRITDVAPPTDLVTKLESLDQFFDDDDAPETISPLAPPSLSSIRLTGSTLAASRETLYDQQTFPILTKTLQRNGSVSSFKHGFADNRPTHARGPSIMSPGAFVSSTSSTTHNTNKQSTFTRPQLHARSVTSPAVNQPIPATAPLHTSFPMSLSEDLPQHTFNDDQAIMSDDELASRKSPGASSTGSGGGHGHERRTTTSTASNSIRSGIRSGIRRLTGGSEARIEPERSAKMTREAIRRDLAMSPEVPKVPDFYLRSDKQ